MLINGIFENKIIEAVPAVLEKNEFTYTMRTENINLHFHFLVYLAY